MSQSELPQPSLSIFLSTIFLTASYFWAMPPKLSVSHAFEICLFSCPCVHTPYSWYTYVQINQSKISWKKSSMLCKYSSFVQFSCTKIKEKCKMAGICRKHTAQTPIQSTVSNQSCCIATTTVLRALASPGLPTCSNTNSAKYLSNFFQCLTTFTISTEFPDILEIQLIAGVSFIAIHKFSILAFCRPFLRRISISSIPLTPPLQKLPGNCFSVGMNSKVTHKKKNNNGRYQKRGIYIRQQLDVSSALVKTGTLT